MQPIRQGDVILVPKPKIFGKKLSHLTLAEGEVTGHKHRISRGKAELYEQDGILYLRVLSATAILSHEEHRSLPIPKGNWMIRIQREYAPQKQKVSSSPIKVNSELQDHFTSQSAKSLKSQPQPSTSDLYSPNQYEREWWNDFNSQISQLRDDELIIIETPDSLESDTPIESRKQATPVLTQPPVKPVRPVKSQPWRHVVD